MAPAVAVGGHKALPHWVVGKKRTTTAGDQLVNSLFRCCYGLEDLHAGRVTYVAGRLITARKIYQ